LTRSLWDRWARATALIAAAMVGGCYESDVPLDPTPQIEVNEAWLGTWRCLPFNADADEQPATMSVQRAADRRYGVTWREGDGEPDHYEAFTSAVDGTQLVNLQERKANEAGGKWVFVRPTLLQPNVLQLQIVDEKALKGVEGTPAAVRQAIARQLSASGLTVDFCVCVRAKQAGEAGKP
jgi:hypothetical protein